VILTYTLTEKEYLDAQYAYRAHLARGSVLFRLMFSIAFGAALAGTYASFVVGNQGWGLGLYLASAYLLVSRVFFWRRRVRREVDQNPDLLGPVEVELTDSGIRIGRETSELSWFALRRYHETRFLFVLLGPAEELCILPKRAVPPGEMLHWIERLRGELKGKGRRDNPDAFLLKFTATWAVAVVFLMTFFVGYVHTFLRATSRRTVRGRGLSFEHGVPPDTRPATVKDLEGHGVVYLVPLGKSQSVLSPDLLSYFRKKYGLEPRILKPVSLPAWTRDEARNQLIAEELVESMKRTYPQPASDPDAVLIGVTDEDMYIAQLDWTYAFNWRQEERFGVVSTARMDPVFFKQPPDPAVLEKRARKLITKNVGLLYYHLQVSSNFSSVLYDSLGDEEDVDDMGEDFLLADAQARAQRHLKDGDPCFTIRHYYMPDKTRADAGMFTSCSGTVNQLNLEVAEVDLRYGLFLDRRTEFYVPGKMPLQFTRVMRTQDSRSRAFGIGGNHSLNIFPVGNRWPFTTMDLVMADGGRVHYKRSNWGFGYWDAAYSESDFGNGKFSNSTISWDWPGWKLVQWSGTTYYFPDGGGIERPEQAALIGIRDREGNALGLQRDQAGNLLQAASSTRGRLNFKYDDHNRVSHIRDAGGDSFDYSYDSGGRLATVRDADGRVTEYSYDAENRMITIMQNGNLILRNDYDSGGRVIRQTLPEHTYTFKYLLDNKGEVTAIDVFDSDSLKWTVHMSFGTQYALEPRRSR
jgi:YD repeat-containing protein